MMGRVLAKPITRAASHQNLGRDGYRCMGIAALHPSYRLLCTTRFPPVTSDPSRRPISRPNTRSTHHTGKKNSVYSGVLRFGLQQPFDDANRREQPDRASGEGGEENDEFLRSHRDWFGNRLAETD